MRKEIKRLIDTCIKINDTTEHHAFVDISPHCNLLRIRVYREGWHNNFDPDFKANLYWDCGAYDLSKIKKTQAYLDTMAKINVVKFDAVHFNTVEVLDDKLYYLVNDGDALYVDAMDWLNMAEEELGRLTRDEVDLDKWLETSKKYIEDELGDDNE